MNTGSYFDVLESAGPGTATICENSDDWKTALECILEQPSLLRTASEAAQQGADQCYKTIRCRPTTLRSCQSGREREERMVPKALEVQ